MRKIIIILLLALSSISLVSCQKEQNDPKKYFLKIIVNDDDETIILDELNEGTVLIEPSDVFSKKYFIFDYWIDRETNQRFSFGEPIEKDLIIEGVWKDDGIRRGTFDREYPDYYELGVPLIDDAHLVYINFDGFARYYFDEALKRDPNNLPNLRKFIAEGVFFENFRTTTPSITNPVQNMIISGATSSVTKNVYRYYDRDRNIVVQQLRENEARTIIDEVIDAGISTASVSFYLAENKLTSDNPAKLYVYQDNTNPKVVERGPEKYGDYFSRFEQAIKLIKGEPIKTGGNTITVETLPRFIMIYADDLDALGHNDRELTGVYGEPNSISEEARLTKVVNYLKEMDAKLGEFIAAAKDKGVYEKMTFILTTDHGMTPFGAESLDSGKYSQSKIGDLRYALSSFNKNFEFEKVEPDQSPSSRTNVVGVGMNLNMQLTFKDGITDLELDNLKEHLLKEDYISVVKTRKELEEEGYWLYAADMIVSPSERYHFAPNPLSQYRVRGQHDSYLDSSNKIFGLIFGKNIKKGYVYNEKAYNYDFGITMAAMLGLNLSEANGIVLDIFEREQ